MPMPSRKGSLSRSPLGQAPINASMYQESFDLLSNSHDSEQCQPVVISRYAASSNGRDFKFKMPSSRFAPLSPPIRGLSNINPQNDPEALRRFPHPLENSRECFDRIVEESSSLLVHSMSTKQRMQGLEEIDDTDDIYLPQKRQCPPQCCCFLTIILCILFTVAIVLASLYPGTKPKPPTLEMEGFNFTRFKYEHRVNEAAPQVAAGLKFVLIVANPNRQVELIYDQWAIELRYQQSLLGNISSSSFKLFKENKKTLVIELPETLTAIQDPLDALKILKEASGFNVQVDLRGALIGHYKLFGIKVKKFRIPVDCKLNVEPENGGRPAYVISSSCYHYAT